MSCCKPTVTAAWCSNGSFGLFLHSEESVSLAETGNFRGYTSGLCYVYVILHFFACLQIILNFIVRGYYFCF